VSPGWAWRCYCRDLFAVGAEEHSALRPEGLKGRPNIGVGDCTTHGGASCEAGRRAWDQVWDCGQARAQRAALQNALRSRRRMPPHARARSGCRRGAGGMGSRAVWGEIPMTSGLVRLEASEWQMEAGVWFGWQRERVSERELASERARERARGTRARRRGAGEVWLVAATRLGRDAHRRQDRRGAATSDDIGSAKNRGRSGPHTLRDEAWDSHRGGCRRTFEGPERACRDARRARA